MSIISRSSRVTVSTPPDILEYALRLAGFSPAAGGAGFFCLFFPANSGSVEPAPILVRLHGHLGKTRITLKDYERKQTNTID